MAPPQVVILGGGISGIATAHKLLKHTTPKVEGLKVVLVSPSTHFYYNPAAVRGLIPDEFSDDLLFIPIRPGFERYPEHQFELLIGTATGLNADANTVHVRIGEGNEATTTDLPYDQLVIATGASVPNGMPFKPLGSHEKTLSAWKQLQANVGSAASITVAGAGPTGVEISAELGLRYGKEKTINLIVQGERVLEGVPGLLTSVQKSAEENLAKLNVNLIHNAKVIEYENRTVRLSTGETLESDLYLPVFGVRPNTSWLPENLLDDKKNLKLDLTLRVEGLTNVWGVGDVGNVESKQVARAEPQVIHLAGNLNAVLTGNEDGVKLYKVMTKPFIFVTLGKHTGVGQYGGIKVFGWVVAMAKGKNMFADKAPGLVAGRNIMMHGV